MAGWEDDTVVAPAPAKAAWEADQIVTPGPRPAAPGAGMWNALVSGYQGSATGLALRRRLPDVVLDHTHAKWYEKALEGAAGTVSELPEMVAGFALGGAVGSAVGPVGTILGGGAGAFAVPTAIRESLIQAYHSGEAGSSADFLSRTGIVLKETGKSALVGAATMGAGALAARTIGGALAPLIGEEIGIGTARTAIGTVQTAAELGTMVVSPAALEGRLPEPQDFVNAAIVVAGMKAAGHVAGRIANIYAKTGIEPEQVVADAKADPKIALDLKPIEAPRTTEKMATLYHGSPFTFEQFDPTKIGTGEGAQVYGHGLYFAENPSVARSYQKSTSEAAFIRKVRDIYEEGDDPREAENALMASQELSTSEKNLLEGLRKDDWLGFDYPHQAVQAILHEPQSFTDISPATKAALESFGNMYKVQISPSVLGSMLDWDKPLSEQSAVLAAVKSIVGDKGQPENWTGKEAYETISDHLGGPDHKSFNGPPAASARLAALGIPGVRYLDRGSRAAGDGTRNYVLFDAKHATVIERNGQTITSREVNTEPEVPRAYKPAAEAEMLRAALPEAPKVAEIIANPRGTITDEKEPNHINYSYSEAPEDILALRARIAEVFKPEIEAARGEESWEATQEKAARIIKERLAGMSDEQKAELSKMSFADLAAQSMAVEAMAQRAAFDARAAALEIAKKGAEATPEDARRLAAAIEQSALLHAVDQGNGAEIARALNSRKAARQRGELAEQMADVLAQYGKDPHVLARMILGLHTTAELTAAAAKMSKATTYEKFVEAWKAGILSGPLTHMANLIGNGAFMALRPAIDLTAAMVGRITGGERLSMIEPFARVFGNLQGAKEALKETAAALEVAYEGGGLKGLAKQIAVGSEQGPQKVEQFRKAIGGVTGDVIRLPFRALSLADDFFKVMNDYGERYALATRQAAKEGHDLNTREFRERIVDLVHNDGDIAEKGQAAALRFTFNTPLGPKGQAVQNLVKVAHLELLTPFIRTPGNLFKEMVRLTPLAPIFKEWRQAYEAGGPERAKAVSEVMMGSAISAVVASYVLDGSLSITGAGDPDPAKRAAATAAGWQPYSIKIGNTYYNYQRLQPVGTLIGMTADLGEVWQHVTEDEGNKVLTMLSVAFANAVTNQTMLQGITSIVQVLADAERYGPRFVQQYAGSVVPAIVAQTTAIFDPVQREVNGILDAVKARIPGARGTLEPKINPFTGEPMEAKQRFGEIAPITETELSKDPVLSEALRLGVGVAKTPKKLQLPSPLDKKAGQVELTPEQRTLFASTSGQLAHQILTKIVGSDVWGPLPDLVKKNIYSKVLTQARKAGAAAALPGEERAAFAQEMADNLIEKLR